MKCPCGCADPVKPWNTYAHGWCTGRILFRNRTHEQQRHAVRCREEKMTPEQKRRHDAAGQDEDLQSSSVSELSRLAVASHDSSARGSAGRDESRCGMA